MDKGDIVVVMVSAMSGRALASGVDDGKTISLRKLPRPPHTNQSPCYGAIMFIGCA